MFPKNGPQPWYRWYEPRSTELAATNFTRPQPRSVRRSCRYPTTMISSSSAFMIARATRIGTVHQYASSADAWIWTVIPTARPST
jgi:hypothetical protein